MHSCHFLYRTSLSQGTDIWCFVKIKTTLFARFEFECVFARNFNSDDLCYQETWIFVLPWIMPVRSAFLCQHFLLVLDIYKDKYFAFSVAKAKLNSKL